MEAESGVEPFEPPEAGIEVIANRRTIVTALPLKKPARQRLAQMLGARVIDIREALDAADVVLTPACSPQLIGGLKRRFPSARVVIVELDDWDFGIDSRGPVKRLLNAGADAYLLADSLDELAVKIAAAPITPDAPATVPAGELTNGATVDELVAAFLRESVEYAARARAESERTQPHRPR